MEKINKAGAIFDINKLNWFNAEYIRRTVYQGVGITKIINAGKKYLPADLTAEMLNKVIKLFASRLNNLAELTEFSQFIFKLPEYSPETLIFKKAIRLKLKLV